VKNVLLPDIALTLLTEPQSIAANSTSRRLGESTSASIRQRSANFTERAASKLSAAVAIAIIAVVMSMPESELLLAMLMTHSG
jgi:hypothetical protein